MLKEIQNCFKSEKVLYTYHAKDEMEKEEFGGIKEREVFEAILNGKIIETYPEDEPHPSCFIYERTDENRPLYIVCAYATNSNLAIIITTYQPNPDIWIDFERRKV